MPRNPRRCRRALSRVQSPLPVGARGAESAWLSSNALQLQFGVPLSAVSPSQASPTLTLSHTVFSSGKYIWTCLTSLA